MAQELFDRASSCLQGQLPFVVYRKPDKNDLIGIFQNNDEVHIAQDFTESGFVFAPFDLKSDAILLQRDSVQKATFPITGKTFKGNEIQLEENAGEKARYLKLVTNALGSINDGDFDKVVLSRKIEIAGREDSLEVFQKILNEYTKAFCYLWHHPKVGTWVGATPEILVKSNGAEFTTMSLAGTQNSKDFKEPQWSKKELKEQQMVTDYINNALKDKVESLKTSELETIRAGQLWHLRTKMEGKFTSNRFGEVLRALHPTPAVCGSPLDLAKKFILENEQYDRTYYTGFLGELNFTSERLRNKNRRNQENSAYRSVRKQSELFVNLRCMQLLKEAVVIYVGGGITNDSIPENEWEETALKSKTMLRVLTHK